MTMVPRIISEAIMGLFLIRALNLSMSVRDCLHNRSLLADFRPQLSVVSNAYCMVSASRLLMCEGMGEKII